MLKKAFVACNQSLLNLFSFHSICKTALALSITFTLVNAKNQTSPIPEVDDKLIENMLPNLIYDI